jgi:hypothetical protein
VYVKAGGLWGPEAGGGGGMLLAKELFTRSVCIVCILCIMCGQVHGRVCRHMLWSAAG